MSDNEAYNVTQSVIEAIHQAMKHQPVTILHTTCSSRIPYEEIGKGLEFYLDRIHWDTSTPDMDRIMVYLGITPDDQYPVALSLTEFLEVTDISDRVSQPGGGPKASEASHLFRA